MGSAGHGAPHGVRDEVSELDCVVRTMSIRTRLACGPASAAAAVGVFGAAGSAVVPGASRLALPPLRSSRVSAILGEGV